MAKQKKPKIIKIPVKRKKLDFQIRLPSKPKRSISTKVPSLKVPRLKGIKLPKEPKFKFRKIRIPSIRIKKLWT